MSKDGFSRPPKKSGCDAKSNGGVPSPTERQQEVVAEKKIDGKVSDTPCPNLSTPRRYTRHRLSVDEEQKKPMKEMIGKAVRTDIALRVLVALISKSGYKRKFVDQAFECADIVYEKHLKV